MRLFPIPIRPREVPNDWPAIIAAAFLAGFPFGLLLKTQFERKLRGNFSPWLPFGHNSMPRLLIGIGIKLPLVLALAFIPSIIAIHIFGLYPLRGSTYQAFALAWLVSILAGKICRYAYWRSKA